MKLAWTLSLTGEPSQTVRHVATPDGCVEIIRRFQGVSSWGSAQPEQFVAGLITFPTELELGGNSSFIGLRLWPWAWNALGRLPCPELLDRWAPLDVAAPGLGLTTLERAWAALESIRVGEDAAALAPSILASRTVEELSAQSGRSHRSLQRWFKRHIGIAPRHYLRLLRFQAAFAQLQGDGASLADHAAAHGFADQAHMAREFRSISGETAHRARKQAKGPFL